MNYLLLIHSNPENWEHPMHAQTAEFRALPESEQAELSRQFEAVMGEISASGELISGMPLADPLHTRVVRVRDGVPVTTDGPYLEAKEQIAGFFVIDCETPERAVEIASRFPDALMGAVEVRPIMGGSGQEM